MHSPLPLTAEIVRALSLPLAAQDMIPGEHFVENWDLDSDGKVSLADATERRDDIFTAFDENEDDVLNGTEYDVFDAARAADMENGGQGGQARVGGGKGMRRKSASMERGASDLNGDGRASRKEFVGNTPAWFAMRNRNGDGFITTADFGPGH